MPGRIAEDPEGIGGAVVADVGYPNGSERQDVRLRRLDLVHVDVEVELLGPRRVGEARRLMPGERWNAIRVPCGVVRTAQSASAVLSSPPSTLA